MEQTRRGLFKMLAAAFVGLKAAPVLAEALPDFKYLTVPVKLTMDDMNAITLQAIMPRLTDQIFVKSPMMYRLRENGVMQHDGGEWKSISAPIDPAYPLVLDGRQLIYREMSAPMSAIDLSYLDDDEGDYDD